MNNVLNVNFRTKTYQTFLQSYMAPSINEPEESANDFEKAVASKIEESISLARTQSAGGVTDTKDMTLEQYKNYIHNKISQIPLHPSQRMNSISIHISDEGFEAMQKDPEYEKWVIDRLKYDFGFNDPWANLCGGSYIVHYFGATKEEYHGHSWYQGYQNGKAESLFDTKAKDSFWERRVRRKKRMEIQFKRQQAKHWQMQKMQDRMYENQMIHRSIAERKRILGENSWSPDRHLELFSSSYETGLLLDLLMMGGGFFG